LPADVAAGPGDDGAHFYPGGVGSVGKPTFVKYGLGGVQRPIFPNQPEAYSDFLGAGPAQNAPTRAVGWHRQSANASPALAWPAEAPWDAAATQSQVPLLALVPSKGGWQWSRFSLPAEEGGFTGVVGGTDRTLAVQQHEATAALGSERPYLATAAPLVAAGSGAMASGSEQALTASPLERGPEAMPDVPERDLAVAYPQDGLAPVAPRCALGPAALLPRTPATRTHSAVVGRLNGQLVTLEKLTECQDGVCTSVSRRVAPQHGAIVPAVGDWGDSGGFGGANGRLDDSRGLPGAGGFWSDCGQQPELLPRLALRRSGGAAGKVAAQSTQVAARCGLPRLSFNRLLDALPDWITSGADCLGMGPEKAAGGFKMAASPAASAGPTWYHGFVSQVATDADGEEIVYDAEVACADGQCTRTESHADSLASPALADDRQATPPAPWSVATEA